MTTSRNLILLVFLALTATAQAEGVRDYVSLGQLRLVRDTDYPRETLPSCQGTWFSLCGGKYGRYMMSRELCLDIFDRQVRIQSYLGHYLNPFSPETVEINGYISYDRVTIDSQYSR